MPPKKPLTRENVDTIVGTEENASIFSTPKSTATVEKPKRKSRSLKSDVASAVATAGTEDNLSSKSSDVGSSNVGSKKAYASSSTGLPETEDFEGPDTNILTPFNKSNNIFQDRLASLTRSDAHHDLSKVFNETSYKEPAIKKAYDAGIPKSADIAYHEGEAFASIIISVTDFEGKQTQIQDNAKPEDKLLEALNAVPDCTNKKENQSYSTFQIGMKEMPIFDYKVVKFIIQCSNNSAFRLPNGSPGKFEYIASKDDFGKKFVENTKLGEDASEAALIVDFSQHHFIEYLTLGPKSDFKIHYLMTPEVVNDPAGKPNVTNKSLFGNKETGVKIMSYVEADINSGVTYTKFDATDPNPANNFFSNYDFTLSPISQIGTKHKAEKLVTTLNIKYDVPNGKPLTDTIEDSKGENSITTVTGYLKKIMEQIRAKINIADTFNFNSKIQQKRGGDWFQALSCIDARNRWLKQILPVESTEPSKLPSTCPVYLVTHDRIAVTFALLNGVNVIYLDYYGRIFVFKNKADRTLKGSGKSMEEILFNGIKEKWINEEGEQNVQLKQLLTTAERYKTDRNQYLNVKIGKQSTGKINDFYTTCTTIKSEMEKYNFNTNKNPLVDFQKVVSSSLQKLFMAAVELAFIQINLIDITKDIETINTTSNMFSYDYDDNDATLKAQINSYSKALNNIKGIQDKFGVIPAESNFITAFDNWIIGNISKLDVYKTAKKVLSDFVSENNETTIFDFNRLLTFFSRNNKEERKTDSNIFLPFIQNLNLESKKGILSVLNVITPKLQIYKSKVDADSASARSSRIGGLHPNKVFYNKLANLLYESYIFIDNSNETDAQDEASKAEKLIELSTSSDNILLKNDKDELNLLKKPVEEGGGKNSNFTGNDSESKDPIDAVNVEEYAGQISFGKPAKIYNLNCKITGESISCTGMQKDSMSGGGGYINSYIVTSPEAILKTESVICDMSLKQINWPLLTANFIEKTQTENLEKFAEEINKYITGLNKEYDDNPEIKEIEENITASVENNKIEKFITAIRNHKQISLITLLLVLAIGLFTYYSGKGGGDSNTSSSPIVSKDLMKDFKLGFHPLTPIYAMLTTYYNILGEKSQSDPFFYTYFTYINILEKMKKVLETNYLNNTMNSPKTASAYMIGFGLYTMMFASHTSMLQNNTILKMMDIDQKEYFEFSLKNDGFASIFSGAIHQTPEEEIIGCVLVDNPLFNNFINNEVNIKQILEEGTSVENLPDYSVLKDRIFQLMDEIVIKVNADRGTPIVSAPDTSTTTTTTTEEPVIAAEEQGVAAGIPGESPEEQAQRIQRLEERQKRIKTGEIQVKPKGTTYIDEKGEIQVKPEPERKTGYQDISKLLTYSETGTPIIVSPSTSQNTQRTRRGGRKRSKRYLNNKKKTIKKRVNKKTSKNTTKKHYRRPRKTRRV